MPEIETQALGKFGLCTVAEAALRRNKSVSAVQRWIQRGHFRPVPIQVGGRVLYLLVIAEVDAFEPPRVGAPAGNANAKKEPAPKPTKTRRSRVSGRKSRNP